jgi:DNA repair exonuclease SbcCD ATPase subunit
VSYASELVQQAKILATSASSRAATLERDLAQIEKRKSELQTQLHAAHLAQKRLDRFVPELGGELQCPRCWIDHGNFASLRPVGGGTESHDIFRCNTCHAEFRLRLR